jgi:hypothetical protein
MREHRATKWLDLLQPRIACQNSLLTTLQTNVEYLEYVQRSLDTPHDEAELTQLDLHNAMQKQTEIVQTVSRVMKAQHDILMNTIQNMR